MIGLSVLDMLLPNIDQYGWAPCLAYFLVGWAAIMILARWTDGLDEWANSIYPDDEDNVEAPVTATVGMSPRKTAAMRMDSQDQGAVRALSNSLSRSGSAVDDDDNGEHESHGMPPTEAPLTAAPLAFDRQLRAKRVKGAILTTVALALHNAPVRLTLSLCVCVCVCVCVFYTCEKLALEPSRAPASLAYRI